MKKQWKPFLTGLVALSALLTSCSSVPAHTSRSQVLWLPHREEYSASRTSVGATPSWRLRRTWPAGRVLSPLRLRSGQTCRLEHQGDRKK